MLFVDANIAVPSPVLYYNRTILSMQDPHPSKKHSSKLKKFFGKTGPMVKKVQYMQSTWL
jgi:hypothetical protein